MSVSELYLNQLYAGRTLTFRVAEILLRMKSIMFLGEDGSGAVCRFSVYPQGDRPLTNMVQVGVELVVRHPWFKMAMDDKPMVRIEDPRNLVLSSVYGKLSASRPSPAQCTSPPQASPAALALDSDAKAAFTAKKLPQALALYSQALALVDVGAGPWPELLSRLCANCSLIHRMLGARAKAREFALQSIRASPGWWRGHLRLAEVQLAPEVETVSALRQAEVRAEAASAFHRAWELNPALLNTRAGVRAGKAAQWFQSPQLAEHLGSPGLSTDAHATVLLGADVDADCQTVAQALELLHTKSTKSERGGTVLVFPGTYEGAVTLCEGTASMIGLGDVTIDCTAGIPNRHTILANGSVTLRLQRLKLKQSFHTLDPDLNLTHALCVNNEAEVTLIDCELTNPRGACVGANDRARVTARDVLISDSYGGIVCGGQSRLQAERISMLNLRYSGVYLQQESSAVIQNSKFRCLGGGWHPMLRGL